MNRSSTSGPRLVAPQAIRALWPRITSGSPGKLTPVTSNGQAALTTAQCRPFMIQTDGMLMPRCGSWASRAWPVALFEPATTQLFEPTPWSPTRPWAGSIPADAAIDWPSAASARRPSAWPVLSEAEAAADTSLIAVAVAPAPAGRLAPAPPGPGSPRGTITGALAG